MLNDCPGCGMKIDTMQHADDCHFKKRDTLEPMTATTQPGITLEEQETRLGGVLAIKREPHYTGVNLPFDLADSILASLIRLREITATPDAWAVRNNQGHWVGIWNDKELADKVAADGHHSHGQVVVPVALLLRGKP